MHSSVVGGSTAARRLQCPGSGALEATLPNESSSYANEGTALHEAMEHVVADMRGPDELLGDTFGTIPALTEEHVECLTWCNDIVDPMIGEHEFDLEVRAPFPGIEGAFGTTDVVVIQPDRLIIADYKFGKGVPVSARGNAQLLFYACCARAKFGGDLFELHILQPRLDSHTDWTVTGADLDHFERRLRRAIEDARPEYRIGDACRFCNAKAICPAQRSAAEATRQWKVAAEDLPEALALAAIAEDWIKGVHTMAHNALSAGATIEGWKLVDKRATRKWAVDDATALAYLRAAGVSEDKAAPRKLISVAQAEKLAKVESEMVSAVSSGTTIAPESDKRPDVGGSRDLASLAKLLEK